MSSPHRIVLGASARRADLLALSCCSAIAFVVFCLFPNHQVADSNYTVLVAENLIYERSQRLDAHFRRPLDPSIYPALTPSGLPYQVMLLEGHVVYAYPIGTSILSIPFVAALNRVGVFATKTDGRSDPDGERRIQALLAASVCAATVAVLYSIARLRFGVRASAAVALLAAFGSSLFSTMSRVLWSSTVETLLLSVCVWLLAAHEIENARLHPALLGTALAWAYFCRPTAALAIVGVLVYLACRRRIRSALETGIAVTCWLAGFALFSFATIGDALPIYYRGISLSFSSWSLEGAVANLVSPSRGLLLFSPILLLAVPLLFTEPPREPPERRLILLCLSVCSAHVLLLGFNPSWWGGHCYGPRMSAELLPWLFLLALLAFARHTGAPLRAVAIALCLWGVFVHARGAGSLATLQWNVTPRNVDDDPIRVWSIRNPQFLAGLP